MRLRYPEAPLHNLPPVAYLPHRFPFLLLERIVELHQGASAAAEVNVTCDTCGFPALYLVEAMAQLGGAAVGNEGEGGFLAAIDSAEFLAEPVPGDILRVTVGVVKSFGRLHMMEGTVSSGERTLAKASFTLGMGKL